MRGTARVFRAMCLGSGPLQCSQSRCKWVAAGEPCTKIGRASEQFSVSPARLGRSMTWRGWQNILRHSSVSQSPDWGGHAGRPILPQTHRGPVWGTGTTLTATDFLRSVSWILRCTRFSVHMAHSSGLVEAPRPEIGARLLASLCLGMGCFCKRAELGS